MRKTGRVAAAMVGCALAVVGCGGDGDSSPQVALTAITEANAAQVSAVVYRAASVLFDVASSSGLLPVGAVVSAAPSGQGGGLALAGFAARQMKFAANRSWSGASGAVGAVFQDTYQCAGGGTVTEAFDDADNNAAVSVGDLVTMSFANCVEEGVTANGVMTFKMTVVTEAAIGGLATFGNLRLNDGTDEIGANGGFNLTISGTPGVSEIYEIVGESLTSTVNGDQHTLAGFAGSAVTDYAKSTVTYTFNGRVSDTSNGIAAEAKTLSAFVARFADDFPASGELRSLGAGGSQALLKAVSASLVQISTDPEGDGSFTAPVAWSWSALEALPD